MGPNCRRAQHCRARAHGIAHAAACVTPPNSARRGVPNCACFARTCRFAARRRLAPASGTMQPCMHWKASLRGGLAVRASRPPPLRYSVCEPPLSLRGLTHLLGDDGSLEAAPELALGCLPDAARGILPNLQLLVFCRLVLHGCRRGGRAPAAGVGAEEEGGLQRLFLQRGTTGDEEAARRRD